MSVRSRRDYSGGNLSFLDCICCAFGAIILLLVISKTSEMVVIAAVRDDMEIAHEVLGRRVAQTRTESRVVEQALQRAREELSTERARVERLGEELGATLGRLSEARTGVTVQDTIEGRLEIARQELTAEMKRLLGERYRRPESSSTIGGIPVDSEYIIFVIDTSGSMQEYAWGLVQKKITETLEIYPKVKGIQVLNDMGDYMFSRYRDKWIPDSPARRKAIIRRLRTWKPFSNSSPVEGIEKAIRTFYSRSRKISIYVFGDEFSGGSIDAVAAEVDRLNRVDRSGNRRVRIHAVGFPTQFSGPYDRQITGVRFATLMRVLAERNGGSFVGLRSASR